MTEQKTGFIAQIRSFPRTFWVANTMEIFERMSWYGWFTVMAVYVTGSVATGGLGFSTELRGTLQAIIPFFLYLLPVLTGALADRYGFKRMFIIAYAMMIVSYFLLGQFTSLPGFVFAFTLVAIGAAIFKPVVVGTVARVTDEKNSATGFGIFYMMVNVGGFLGPIIAGMVRGWGWEYVFIACSGWAVVNMILVLIFYKEPARETADVRKLSKVLDGLVEVLGNLRFFITVGVVLIGLVLGSVFASLEMPWFSWGWTGILLALWIVANLLVDRAFPKESGRPDGGGPKRNPLLRRMHCSNWRFALFLLIMSGFWTSFNQIFYTMPEYIRDFTETRPAIRAAEKIFGKSDPTDPNSGVASKMATINEAERAEIVRVVQELQDGLAPGREPAAELFLTLPRERFDALVEGAGSPVRAAFPAEMSREELADRLRVAPPSEILALTESARKSLGTEWRDALEREALENTSRTLLYSKVRMAPDKLRTIVEAERGSPERATDRIIISGRQMNPEFIVNINALGIVLFQVIVSFLMGRFHRFTTMIVGMIIAAVGIGFSAIAGTEGMIGAGGLVWIVAAGILTFSFGEMMASPTSQEYVGRIAPGDKKALYMGYYFVAVALGNLFGGILSGQFYGTLARDMQRPDLMWLAFGGVMLLTALIFVAYNRFALPRERSASLTG